MSITKIGKKLFCLLALLLMAFVVISCETTEPTDEAKETAQNHNQTIYDQIYWDASAMVNITSSKLTLITTTKFEDTVVSWTSSDEAVISATGNVSRPAYTHENATLVKPSDPEDTSKHVEVKLTAKITTVYGDNKEISQDKEFKFTVLCLDENMDFGTIASIKANAYKYIYEEKEVQKDLVSNSSITYNVGFYGVVTGILNASGAGQFMVHDGTEGIYVYSSVEGLKVGDTVLVYGDVYSYYGSLQVGKNITVAVVEDRGIELPQYTNISVEDWEHGYEIGYLGGKLYSIYAKLETGSNSPASDTYKLVDPFTGEEAWIYYKSYNVEQEELLKSYVGKYVNVTGVSYDRDSRCLKNHLLWDGGIEEAAAPTLTDEQKVANVQAILEKLAGEYASGEKVTFPTENEEYEATIKWELPADAPYENGKFNIVEITTKFVATAEITVGSVTKAVNVEITVKPVEEVTVAEAAKLPKDSVVKLTGTVETIFGSKGNFYLKDATGNMLVYVTTKDGITVNDTTVALTAGDQITLVGTTASFNGTPQIGTVISYEAHKSTDWEISAPKQTTFEELAALTSTTAPYGQYLMLRGKIVSDGNYFLFSNGTVSVSLYNSNVPEAVKAVKDTDTEVTLFFYYYGNSKADYSGVIRVIFSGREGEYFVGDQEVVVPVDKDPLIKDPQVGTEYVMSLVQGNLKKTLYFGGAMSGNFFATVETLADAAKVVLEEAQGGYHLYVMVNGSKKYVEIYLNDSNKNAVRLADTATCVWTFNTEYNTLVTTLNEKEYYLGTYSTYTTISSSALSYAATSFVLQLFDPTKIVEEEPEPQPEKKPIVTEFAVKGYEELSAMVPEAGNTTEDKYYVAGYIKSVTNTTYGNMLIETYDGTEQLNVYGTYNLDGTKKYGEMTSAPQVGQAVVLYGVMNNYNGTVQMKNAWIVQIDDKVCEAPKHEHVACPECGKCISKDCDGTAEEKCEGHGEAATMPQELNFAGAANKASGDDYMKANFAAWEITGKLGQTYGGYLGFGRSGDAVSGITSNDFATTKEFTVTAVIKGNGSNGVVTSTLTFELLDKDGNVVATGYATGTDAAPITPVDAQDTTYTIEFTFAEGKTIADAQNLKISFSKVVGNIGLKSVVYNEKE